MIYFHRNCTTILKNGYSFKYINTDEVRNICCMNYLLYKLMIDRALRLKYILYLCIAAGCVNQSGNDKKMGTKRS
jgi:hypothetical protein